MRHLIHVTRTASGTRELAAPGATTIVRIRALERQIPDELRDADERGDTIDHLRDERFLAAEVAHAGDPDVVVAIGFAFAACAAFASSEGATIEALLELDQAALTDDEQRARVGWLLDSLKRVAGSDRVHTAPPSSFEELLRSSVARQQN